MFSSYLNFIYIKSMKDLFKNWKTISLKIQKSPHILLLSDFDGTLCPIVKHPDLVKVDKDILAILKKINKLQSVMLGFVSGRPINDIKKHIGLRKAFYIGNHGLEFKKPNDSKIQILSKAQIKKSLKVIRSIVEQLKDETETLKGVWLEDKKYSVSLHYRQATSKDARVAAKIFNQVISEAEKNKNIRVTRGKKVFEIRPSFNQNKGTAVEKLKRMHSKKSPLLIYLGDDVTDEDVFKIMSKKDLSIHIGKGDKSAAQYSLKNVKAVGDFFQKVYRIRSGKTDA